MTDIADVNVSGEPLQSDQQRQAEPNWLAVLRRWLIDPIGPLPPRQMQQAQALGALTLVLLVLGILFTLIYLPTDATSITVRLSLFGLVLMTIVYLISRTPYQSLARILVILVLSLPIYIVALPTESSTINDIHVLSYLIVPTIVTAVFARYLHLMAFIALNIVGMLLMGITIEDIPLDELVAGPLSLYVAVSSLTVIGRRGYELLNLVPPAQMAPGPTADFRPLEFYPEMIAIHSDGLFRYVNRAGAHLLGVKSAEELIGQPVSRYLSLDAEESQTARMLRVRVGEQFAMRSTEKLTSSTGDIREVEVTMAPILHEGKLSTQLIVRDITAETRMKAHLNELESNYRTLIELMADYSYEVRFTEGDARQVVWISDGFTTLTGFSKADLNNHTHLRTIVHPEDESLASEKLRKLMKGQAAIAEYRILARDGRTIWIRDHARPILDVNGKKVVGYTGMAQNITERADAELSLKNHALQQAVVAEIGQRALDADSDANFILTETVILTAQVLDTPFCRYYELNEDETCLIVRSSCGWDGEDDARAVRDTSTPTSQPGYTFLMNEAVVSTDLSQEDRFTVPDDIKERGIKSSISVVVQGPRQPVGVLIAYAVVQHDFLLDDINFMQAIANVLGAFVEGQRIQASEREQRDFAEAMRDLAAVINSTLEFDEVLDRVLANLSHVVPYDSASIMLIEDNVARIIRHTGHEAFNPDIDALYKLRFNVQEVKNLAEMVNENRPVVVRDIRQRSDWQSVEATNWIRSYVGAPIIFHGTPLGIINLDSAKTNSFNETHGHRLMSFADQVAIALRNARHTDELAQLVAARTAELDAERRRMQTILEATGEGIVYTTQGRIVYANEAFYRITGYDPGTLEGQRMQALLYDLEDQESEAIQQAAQAHLERAEVWRGEMRFRKADGSFFDAGLTISRADSVTGNFDMVTLIRDISTFKQLEAQKARFIANASHELRTPISSLNTRLYIMRRDPEKMEYHLQLLNRISEQMSQLLADMLDHSRFENGVIELRRHDVILQNIISDMAEVQRDEAMVRKTIDLAITMPQEPLHVFVDPGRMGQVLTNLISNAINYTPQNGRIEVLVYTEDGDAPSQQKAVIAVRDSGVGISHEHLANIFEPFYRGPTEEKGTGLGLSISREIVQLHDGELTVESERGVGSTFYVRLPMLPPGESDKL